MAETTVGIVDYGVGNLRSVAAAVAHVGAVPRVSGEPGALLACDRLILPGVGAFAHGMQALRDRGLERAVQDFAAGGRPCLGICLGMQLLFQTGTEFAPTPGLGLLAGTVEALSALNPAADCRLPNVGWLPLVRRAAMAPLAERLLDGIAPGAEFYFVHSFAAAPDVPDAAATSTAARIAFTSLAARANLAGTQFHPEKSGPAGLRMLANFVA